MVSREAGVALPAIQRRRRNTGKRRTRRAFLLPPAKRNWRRRRRPLLFLAHLPFLALSTSNNNSSFRAARGSNNKTGLFFAPPPPALEPAEATIRARFEDREGGRERRWWNNENDEEGREEDESWRARFSVLRRETGGVAGGGGIAAVGRENSGCDGVPTSAAVASALARVRRAAADARGEEGGERGQVGFHSSSFLPRSPALSEASIDAAAGGAVVVSIAAYDEITRLRAALDEREAASLALREQHVSLVARSAAARRAADATLSLREGEVARLEAALRRAEAALDAERRRTRRRGAAAVGERDHQHRLGGNAVALDIVDRVGGEVEHFDDLRTVDFGRWVGRVGVDEFFDLSRSLGAVHRQ